MRLFRSQQERKEQHFTPGKFTCVKLPEDKQDECGQTSLYEISRNRLRVIEKLGEGNFGMVSHSVTPSGISVSLSARKYLPNARNVIGMYDDI